MQGFEDPFNRGTYPWSRENKWLIAWFVRLGELRNCRESLQRGDITYLIAEGWQLAFRRRAGSETSVCAVNAGEDTVTMELPWDGSTCRDAMTGRHYFTEGGKVTLRLKPYQGALLIET